MISKKLNIFISSNDKIRRVQDNLGITASSNQHLVERLTYDRTKYMLENGTSMILDANCLIAYKSVEENFSYYKAPCFFILLEYSEAEILKRLDYREKTFDKDITNFSRATKEDYYLYLKN